MENDLEALMWGTLERCGRTSEGYRLDARHPLIALLITEKVLRRRKGGFVVLTDKGRAIFKLRPKAKAKRSGRSARRTGESDPLARAATA